MNHYYDSFSTPAGTFSVAVNDDGAVIATAFGGTDELRSRFKSDQLVRDARKVAPVREQIDAYFAGERDAFTVKTAPAGTSFQKSVWAALNRIPFGETRTYGELAGQLGRKGAARAVGRANATNPICLIVPCHRVIGSDGSLTGFAFGEVVKKKLLEHEGAAK